MYLRSLATAVPTEKFTQQDCWEIFTASPAYEQVHPMSRELLNKVLLGDNGIDERYFAAPDIPNILDRSAEDLNRIFEQEAPPLGVTALHKALDQVELRKEDLDGLIVCTCTGYLCPGLSSYISEQMGLRGSLYLQDVVGLGCGAAIPTLRAAAGAIALEPEATVAVLAVEVCSAAFFIDNDPGVLVSLCLFGDGAAASIWQGHPPENQEPWRCHSFSTTHRPEFRECLRFENKDGKLRNRLHRSVPKLAADAVRNLYDKRQTSGPVGIVSHGGGRDVINEIASRLNVRDLPHSRETLRTTGNLSSPSVLFTLEKHLDNGHSDDHLFLTSFGAGFAAHACMLSRV